MSIAKALSPPFTFGIFFDAKAWTGRGDAAGFTKAPVGISAITHEIQSHSAKRGGDLSSRSTRWKEHRLVISRSPMLPPRPKGRLEPLELLIFLEK